MSNKQLVRSLGLGQVLMLGIGGTMGAGVFVLTGHAAGMVGPAVILVFLLAALQSLPNSLSYAELASTFPVAGGGYAYTSKATKGLLPFIVGWVSWFSSMVYAALSALGAAYSLNIFLPFLPVPLTAIGFVIVFVIVSARGSEEAGKAQVILAGVLLTSLATFVLAGLLMPRGFTWAEFYRDGGFFIHEGTLENMAAIFQAITLVNVLFVGYEVIATTAEEAKDPGRNIPIAVVGTIFICAAVYCAVAFVALGVISARRLGMSSTPLSDAAAQFFRYGAPVIGVAGIIATLTSLNTAMLSSARVALALSRDGYLPAFLSRINPRLKTPLPAILVTGLIVAIAAISGDEVFLGYVSNFGYMFVVFFTNVSVILLRRKFPDVERPFRTPWYPVMPILGCLGIAIVEIFTELHALVVGIGLILVGVVVYQLRHPVSRAVEVAAQTVEAARREILVPVANPMTAEGLIHMAAILGQAREEATLAILSVTRVPSTTPLEVAQEMLGNQDDGQKALVKQAADYAHTEGVPARTLMRAARGISDGILSVAESRGVGLILMGWHGQLSTQRVSGSIVKDVVHAARCDVAVLRDRGVKEQPIRRILVPIGGGPHARLALRLAWDVARAENGAVTALRIVPDAETCDLDVEMDVLRQLVEDVLGEVPEQITFSLQCNEAIVDGVLAAAEAAEEEDKYDMVAIGASEEWFLKNLLFGSIPDRVANGVDCSVLMVRKHEPAPVSWARRTMKGRNLGDESPE